MEEYTINAGEKGLEDKREEARKLCYSLNNSYVSKDDRNSIYKKLFGKLENYPEIWANFFCEFGNNISFGENVFIHCNCVLNDTGEITIDNNTKIGANCKLHTSKYQENADKRKEYKEITGYIIIREDVLIGNNVTIMHNVLIENECYIGDNVLIHSGIKIDKGTHIKEGSILVKDNKGYYVLRPQEVLSYHKFFIKASSFIKNLIKNLKKKLGCE